MKATKKVYRYIIGHTRTSYEAGISAERDRCYAIVERARFGEIDRDWRSILHRIECGMAANED